MVFIRGVSSLFFLLTVVISVPLAFDVGGSTCGLAFSVALASFYAFYSTLQLVTRSGPYFTKALVRTIGLTQWLIIPSLLIWSLNRFSIDASNNGNWVERTLGVTRSHHVASGFWEKLFGEGSLFETATVTGWEKVLTWSSPVFQLLEGFCTLLVIQAAGQMSRWLVNRERGDSWMIALLVFSSSIISMSVYFLWRLTQFPDIASLHASLIGVTITSAVILCAWGIGSRRGNPVESSLLFAYVVLSLYQIFTNYIPSNPSPASTSAAAAPSFPPFPPVVMASYTTITNTLSTLPGTLLSAFRFLWAALATVTPSVLISLTYRLFVFYAATRIIPAVRENGARSIEIEPTLEESEGVGKILAHISWYSPTILVAVYTSLLMQHFAAQQDGGNYAVGSGLWAVNTQANGAVWKWVNIGGTMVLYALELYLSADTDTTVAGNYYG